MTIIENLQKGIKDPKKAWSVVIYKLQSIFGTTEYKKFIVLTRSRTGSNLLLSLLNSHQNIKVDGEIFNRLNGGNYKILLASVYSKQPKVIKVKGFKIFYYHPLDDKSCAIWEDLKSMEDLYVIHLTRENILETLVSRKIAGIQDVWSIKAKTDAKPKVEKVQVDFTVEELEQGFRETRQWEEDADNSFKHHPILNISYEQLVSDRSNTFRKVVEFLGLTFVEPKTELRKQNAKSLRDVITTYDDLKSAFAETKWAGFFKD